MMDKRQELIAAARARVGERFRHQGRGERGYDCAGLLEVVAAEVFGWPAPRRGNYPKRPSGALVFAELRKVARRISAPEALGGDIVQMAYENEPTHLGLLTEDGTVIHAYVTARRVVEERIDEAMLNRIVAWWRLKQFEPSDPELKAGEEDPA